MERTEKTRRMQPDHCHMRAVYRMQTRTEQSMGNAMCTRSKPLQTQQFDNTNIRSGIPAAQKPTNTQTLPRLHETNEEGEQSNNPLLHGRRIRRTKQKTTLPRNHIQ